MNNNVKNSKMKAANLYAPGDIRVGEVCIPEPNNGEALIKVKACGVCGSDLSRIMKTGAYHYPIIPGHEFSGEIVALRNTNNNFKIGDRVTVFPLIPCYKCEYCEIGEYQLCNSYGYLGSRLNGAFAEYVLAPIENILKIPENISFETAAMTDPTSVALHAIRKLDIVPGDKVAIFGSGPIGLLALQWAKLMGAGMLIAVDISEKKLSLATELGANLCINALNKEVLSEIMNATSGQGVERTIEFAGNKVTQEQCIKSTKKLGCCVFAGISHSELTLSESSVDNILRKELTIKGSWNSSFSSFLNDWSRSLHFMGENQILCEPLISHKLNLEKLPEMFKLMTDRKEYYNKVMFLL